MPTELDTYRQSLQRLEQFEAEASEGKGELAWKIRGLFDQIQKAKAAGHSYKRIADELQRSGLRITGNLLALYIRREKQRRAKLPPATSATSANDQIADDRGVPSHPDRSPVNESRRAPAAAISTTVDQSNPTQVNAKYLEMIQRHSKARDELRIIEAQKKAID